ncbi:unnamed protein product [Closterium sp. NIES-54]
MSGLVAASSSCQLLAQPSVLWHHCMGHPSIPRPRAMSSQRLVLGLPCVLPSLPPSLAPPCGPYGPALHPGPERESFFLVVVDDYSRYTTAPMADGAWAAGVACGPIAGSARAAGAAGGPLAGGARAARAAGVPILSVARATWVAGGPLAGGALAAEALSRLLVGGAGGALAAGASSRLLVGVRLQLCERFRADLLVMRLHSDRGGELSSDLLWDIFMEVARTSMIHAAAPPFLWPFATSSPPALFPASSSTSVSERELNSSRPSPLPRRRQIFVYVDDLIFATADTKALPLVMSELQKRQTCTDLGEVRIYLGLYITRDRARPTITLTQSHMVHQVLQRFVFRYSSPQSIPLPTGHLLSAPPSDEFVEPSGPYPKLVSCLMYLMTRTRPDLAYPLSILARYVAPVRQ